jgi:hypothetical protein
MASAWKQCRHENQNRCDDPWWLGYKSPNAPRSKWCKYADAKGRVRCSLIVAFGHSPKEQREAKKMQPAFEAEIEKALREHREPFTIGPSTDIVRLLDDLRLFERHLREDVGKHGHIKPTRAEELAVLLAYHVR